VVERIDSIDDPRLADYQHVGDPPWLRQRRFFVAEGRLVVQRALAQPSVQIHSILVTPAAHAAMVPGASSVPTYVVSQAVMNQVTGFNFHRGCLAIVHRPDDRTVEEVATGPCLLALEGVGNPDNVGGLFRVAAAFGVKGILLDPASGDPYYRKALRTSMGSTLTVPFARDPAWPRSLESCRAGGYRIVALTPRPSAVPIGSVDLSSGERLVLMAGAEGHGLTDVALEHADLQVRIPIAEGVDSLNVVVATGIALALLR
jgi:tRNA G18 (ribose-2'-O)-methylase SpoU